MEITIIPLEPAEPTYDVRLVMTQTEREHLIKDLRDAEAETLLFESTQELLKKLEGN
jgi:hypothetical protein